MRKGFKNVLLRRVYIEHLPCSSSGSCSLKKLHCALFQAPDVKYFSQDKKKKITVHNNTLKRGYHSYFFFFFLEKMMSGICVFRLKL